MIATPQVRPNDLHFNRGRLAFLAPVYLVALLAPWSFTWTNLALAIGLHALLGGLGICVGYHISHVTIRLFDLIGLVRDIRVPSAERLRALLRAAPSQPPAPSF